MAKWIIASAALFLAFCAHAQVLPKDSLERRQLLAMGYTFDKEDPNDTFTVAILGSTRVVLEKNDERLVISRYFTIDKKLTNSEENDLLRILNNLNHKFSYQFVYKEGYFSASIYNYGEFDPKIFAKMIRMIDRVDIVYDTQPEIYKIVRK